jgi:phospholipid-binding lipoprotein MlaA
MRPRRVLVLVLAAAGVLAAWPAIADDDASDDAPVAIVDETPDYDPWQPFNERTFWFNYYVLDKRMMKPVARAWDRLVPGELQRALANAFDNISMPQRLVNHILQVRPRAIGEEVARFMINSTVGAAGFMDIADRVGVHGSDADAGQTLGVWGIGPGPYLVVPFLPLLTLRDGVGYGADAVLDPVGYFVPIPFVVSITTTAARRVNDRSLQPAAYENIEETVLDLYSAARNVHLQRRRRFVEQGREDSPLFRRSANPAP